MTGMPTQETISLVQAYSGVYGAFVSTLSWLFPRLPGWGLKDGPSMRPPPLIALGMAVLGLSIAIPALYRILPDQIATGSSVAIAALVAFIVALPKIRDMGKKVVRLSDFGTDEDSISQARWVCVRDPKAYTEAKAIVQGVCRNRTPVLLNNDTLDDPCKKYHPNQEGHGKKLIIVFSRKQSITVWPNHWLRF